MVMTFAECVEDDVREAVFTLNINGELVADDSKVAFNSKDLTIVAHPGFTKATVRRTIEDHEVKETLTMETTKPKSICLIVYGMTDRLATLAKCVTILEGAGWSVTKTKESTVFMSNKDKAVSVEANTWDIFINGKSRQSAAKILHEAGVIKDTKSIPYQPGTYRLDQNN